MNEVLAFVAIVALVGLVVADAVSIHKETKRSHSK